MPADLMDIGLQAIGWEALLNRKGTTWRKLDTATQDSVVDSTSAKAIMLAHPSVVKRPVVHWSNMRLTAGFEQDFFSACAQAKP